MNGWWIGLTTLATAVVGAVAGYLLKWQAASHTQKQQEIAVQVEALRQVISDLRAHSAQQEEQIRQQQELIADLYEEAASYQAAYSELYGWATVATTTINQVTGSNSVSPPARYVPRLRRSDLEFRARQARQNAILLAKTEQSPAEGKS